MEISKALKAIADDTRLKMVTLLLQQNYCVRALSRKLDLSESAVSQHIRVLKEAGLLIGVKKGYYMHYDVDRSTLRAISSKIEELAAIEREVCDHENTECESSEKKRCHAQSNAQCFNKVQPFCPGENREEGCSGSHGNCQCHKS